MWGAAQSTHVVRGTGNRPNPEGGGGELRRERAVRRAQGDAQRHEHRALTALPTLPHSRISTAAGMRVALRAQRGPGVTANTHFCQPSFSIIDWPKPPYDGTACCSGNFIEVLAAPERASQSGRSSTLLYVLKSRVPHCSVGGSVPPIQHYLPIRHGAT